jgi:hypothetical protein
MVRFGDVLTGMAVVGSDGKPVGTVAEARQGDFHLNRPRARDVFVPYAAVAEVVGNTVRLSVPGDRVGEMGWPHPALFAPAGTAEEPPSPLVTEPPEPPRPIVPPDRAEEGGARR